METNKEDLSQLNKVPIGATVCLVTSAKYKYAGVVAAINSVENTITLQDVRFGGMDGRENDNSTTQTTESKEPAVGTLFECVTFWMSNVIKLSVTSQPEPKKELPDNAVKAVEVNSPIKKPVATHGDILSPSSNSHADGNHERRHNRGPRNYGYNPRRGRNSGGPRPPFGGYNPSPMQMQSGGRGRYGAPHNDFPTYRMQDGRQGRRSGPNGGRHRPTYPQDAGNGGMFVYLPPEMAAMYRPQGMPVMQQPPYNGRRNHGRRRNFERRSGQPRTAPGFNVKPPDYDFETANAELEVELAKISLNPENARAQDSPSSGDRQLAPISSEGGANLAGKTTDSGASGDAITTGIAGADAESSTTAEAAQALSRGEFYVREKCFFDQISRSEGGPRGPGSGQKPERSRFIHEHSRGQGSRLGNGPSMSTARRERQLNIETFGPIATRNAYNPRRRPNGNVQRNAFVSATA